MKMKRTSILMLVLAFSAAAIFAQQRAIPAGRDAKTKDALPTVDQVLDKYVQAIGGKPALAKHVSRTSKGSIEIEGQNMTGTTESYLKAPNKMFVVLRFPGHGMIRQGFDGTTAWVKEPGTPLKELTGKDLAASKRSNDFYRSIKLKELYPRIELKGKKRIDGHDSYALSAVADDGSQETLFFDVQTGFLIRTSREGSIQIDFDDYRDVGGLKVPFLIRQANPEFTIVMKLADVQFDVSIDDAKFSKPAGAGK